jgi:hypothetical protein
MYHKSIINFVIHMASFVACVFAMYSASERRMLTKRNLVGFRGNSEKEGKKALHQRSQSLVPALKGATITSRRNHNVAHERSLKGFWKLGFSNRAFFQNGLQRT